MHGGLSLAPAKFPDLEIVVRSRHGLNPTLQETVHPFNLRSLRGLGAEARLVVPIPTQPRTAWKDEALQDIEMLFDFLGPSRREPSAVDDATSRRCQLGGSALDTSAGQGVHARLLRLYAFIERIEEPYQTRRPLSDAEDHEARTIIAELRGYSRFVTPLCGVLRPLVPSGWTDFMTAAECQECGDSVSSRWRGLQCHAGGHRVCWRCVVNSIAWNEPRVTAFGEIPLAERDDVSA